MRRVLLLAAAPGGLFISACLIGGLAGYRINLTSSLPPGLWRQAPADSAPYVELCLPEGPFAQLVKDRGYVPAGTCPAGLVPLLKPVVARAGDTVTVTEGGIAVNGLPRLLQPPASTDSQGRPLQPVAPGVYRVEPGSLWVLSTYHPRSLDSRYFGPVSQAQVLAGMRPVLVLNQRADYPL